jgi:CheY-like chemotaxis protein
MTTATSTKTYFLLVEDDDDHAELVKYSMRSGNSSNHLDRVSNGMEAIQYLKKETPYSEARRPDVILLDLNMPMVNGHEVIEFVKNDPELKTIPVVVLTTSNAEGDRTLAYESHANSYVVKPVEFKLFQKMISDLEEFWSLWNQSPIDSDVA